MITVGICQEIDYYKSFLPNPCFYFKHTFWRKFYELKSIMDNIRQYGHNIGLKNAKEY